MLGPVPVLFHNVRARKGFEGRYQQSSFNSYCSPDYITEGWGSRGHRYHVNLLVFVLLRLLKGWLFCSGKWASFANGLHCASTPVDQESTNHQIKEESIKWNAGWRRGCSGRGPLCPRALGLGQPRRTEPRPSLPGALQQHSPASRALALHVPRPKAHSALFWRKKYLLKAKLSVPLFAIEIEGFVLRPRHTFDGFRGCFGCRVFSKSWKLYLSDSARCTICEVKYNS